MNKTKFIFRQTKSNNIFDCNTIAICPEIKGYDDNVGYYVYSGFGRTTLKYGNYYGLMLESIPIDNRNIEHNELKSDLESMGYIVDEITEEEYASLVS